MTDKWQGLVEEKIKQGFEEGAFDDLPGRGQPLKLDDENPFEDPTMRMGYRLLRNNGFTLPWIQERKEIAEESERLCAELTRTWHATVRARAAASDHWQTELQWQRGVTAFRQHVAELNERIRRYNFQVPAARFQRLPLDADRELARVTQTQPPALALTQVADAPTDPTQGGGSQRRHSLCRRARGLWRGLRARLLGRLQLLRLRRAAFAVVGV